jgi:histidine triad (HIT) family protein
MSQACIFCKIINKEINSNVVYEDELVFAFRDINPQAPTHILIVTKKHIPTLLEANADNETLLGHLFTVAKNIARKEGIAERGFRTVVNCNAEAGQTVFHLHMHLLGGRVMGWPPG